MHTGSRNNSGGESVERREGSVVKLACSRNLRLRWVLGNFILSQFATQLWSWQRWLDFQLEAPWWEISAKAPLSSHFLGSEGIEPRKSEKEGESHSPEHLPCSYMSLHIISVGMWCFDPGQRRQLRSSKCIGRSFSSQASTRDAGLQLSTIWETRQCLILWHSFIVASCPLRIDSSVIMWGAVGGGIGMRWKAFADQDVLNSDALIRATQQKSIEMCTRRFWPWCALSVPMALWIEVLLQEEDALLTMDSKQHRLTANALSSEFLQSWNALVNPLCKFGLLAAMICHVELVYAPPLLDMINHVELRPPLGLDPAAPIAGVSFATTRSNAHAHTYTR